MDVRTAFRVLAVLSSLAALGCGDATGPGCRGLACRPVPGIVISGAVVPPGSERFVAIVHLTLFEPIIPPRDSVDRCAGIIIRDTVVFTTAATNFNVLLLAGFPVLQGCLVLRATPDAASGLRSTVVSFPAIVFRDTSAHDTLRTTIAVRP